MFGSGILLGYGLGFLMPTDLNDTSNQMWRIITLVPVLIAIIHFIMVLIFIGNFY